MSRWSAIAFVGTTMASAARALSRKIGAVGAVVINAAREAVRACYFTGGTWAPEDTTLHLQTVPALGSPEHADWPHTWDQFITRNL